MSIEPFLYLLLFLFIALLSLVMRWLRGEIEKSAGLEEKSKAFGLFQESPAPFVFAEETPRARERRIREVSSVAPARPRRKARKVKIHPENLQEVRRGIVLMTVLGPCRALEPPNEALRF
jgi:hypothetical protein